MSKRTSPLALRLGISSFWDSTIALRRTESKFKQRFNFSCLNALTNLFYKEKIYFSRIGIKSILLNNVYLQIDYYLPLPSTWHTKRLNVNTKRIRPLVYAFQNYWFVTYRNGNTIKGLKELSRFQKIWKKKLLQSCNRLQLSVQLRIGLKGLKIRRSISQHWYWRFSELRLKNYLESLIGKSYDHYKLQISCNLRNLAKLYEVHVTAGKHSMSINSFGLIRNQILNELGARRDGHKIFWFVTSLIICGCYTTSSHLLLMWLTLKLSSLKKFDLYYTQTKLITLFFTILRNVSFLFNTIDGVRLRVTGKLNGKMRASARTFVVGRPVAGQQLLQRLDYNMLEAYTYSGTLNCQLWLLKC